MADEKEKKEGASEEEKSGGGNKTMLIIIIAVVVLVLAVVGVLVMTGALGGKKSAPQANAPASPAIPAQSVGDLIPMDTLIVNLNEPGGNRYLKITLKLEVTSSNVAEEMAEKKVPIKSDLIMYLSSLTLSETQSIDAKKKIMINVKNRINSWLSKGKVTRVFFDEFVIQ